MFTNPYHVWQWRDDIDTSIRTGTQDLNGFDVEAADGTVGTVDDSGIVLGTTCLVVDNDPWIPGRKMILPAGTVESVDPVAGVVRLDRTEAQVRMSPGYDPKRSRVRTTRTSWPTTSPAPTAAGLSVANRPCGCLDQRFADSLRPATGGSA